MLKPYLGLVSIKMSIWLCNINNHTPSLSSLDSEAPHLLQNLSDYEVSISGSTTLDCQARGVPAPQITWFKNNHKIQQEPGKRVFSLASSHFPIPRPLILPLRHSPPLDPPRFTTPHPHPILLPHHSPPLRCLLLPAIRQTSRTFHLPCSQTTLTSAFKKESL